MKNLITLVLFLDVYAIVYYRLLVRWHYQQQTGKPESAFGALFSFPPYAILAERGRRYVRRYWAAMAVLLCCVMVLARIMGLGSTLHV